MAELLQWWNLIFVLPFIGALFYVLLLCTGSLSADHDAELNVDIDHDADLDHDAGLADGHEFGAGMLAHALSVLGIGRVPLSIIVISFCFIWGFTGFASNSLLKAVLPSLLFVWVSLAVALAAAVILTGSLARLMARIMPVTESYAVSLEQLIGRWGEAATRIDESFGQAIVHDDAGMLHTVQCLVRSGEHPIPKGSRVILIFFDKRQNAFFVGTEEPVAKTI